jgi:lantibiotic modifying enzyme
VAERGNWPDFRSTSKANEFVHAWCNGAPGILLSRLVIQVAGLADEQTSAELQAARSSTVHALARMAQHQIIPAHLCCGLFGLTSLLRLDALISGTALAPQVPEAEAEVVNRAQVRGDYTFFSVDSGSLNLPGLFTGKAGVVLALQEAANGIHWIGPVLSAGMLAVKPG